MAGGGQMQLDQSAGLKTGQWYGVLASGGMKATRRAIALFEVNEEDLLKCPCFRKKTKLSGMSHR